MKSKIQILSSDSYVGTKVIDLVQGNDVSYLAQKIRWQFGRESGPKAAIIVPLSGLDEPRVLAKNRVTGKKIYAKIHSDGESLSMVNLANGEDLSDSVVWLEWTHRAGERPSAEFELKDAS